MPNIKLQSSDGEIFDVDVEIANRSATIKNMLEDLGMDEGDIVPLPKVNSAILKTVIDWCIHDKDDPPPPESDENKEQTTVVSPWNKKFLSEVDQGTLFEIILAANYLDCRGLFKVACRFVAIKLEKMSIKEICEEYNIKNDNATESTEAAETVATGQRKRKRPAADQ